MVQIVRRSDAGQSTVPTFWEPMRTLDPFRMLRDMMRWEPLREMGALRAMEPVIGFEPSFDLKETKDGYVIKADLPGVREQDLDIAVRGNRLQISGSREAEAEEKSDTFYTCERAYGTFTRIFTMPDDADLDKVAAELKEGILTVNLGKRPESKAKHISIKK